MLVHKICQQVCPDKLHFKLSSKLGDGADGEVFELQDQLDQVIKFSILYQTSEKSIESEYQRIKDTLSFILENQPSTYARVYEHKYIGKYTRPFNRDTQDYIIYYYIMEKLFKISEDEKRVFHSILSHEDKNINKNFSIFKIKKMLDGMARALDFDHSMVMFFCESLQGSLIQHNDIHVRNIMKDKDGNFKLIDFDRCNLV